MSGFDQRKQEERKKYEFDTWLLHLEPINLYNVDLVYLAFGYRNDVRSELDQRWDMRKEKYDKTN